MPTRTPQAANLSEIVNRSEANSYVSKTIEARVHVNLPKLDAAILTTGKSERSICELANIEPRNLSNWRKGRRSLRSTLEQLPTVLAVDVRELILEELSLDNSSAGTPHHAWIDATSPTVPPPFATRKITGHWNIDGEDVVAPPDFVYSVAPRQLGGSIELLQDGVKIAGKGTDHEGAPLDFQGEFIGPDHIRGTYDIDHPRMGTLSGVLVGAYQRCGTKITGHYVGREAGGYGVDFLLGRFTLTLIGSRDQ